MNRTRGLPAAAISSGLTWKGSSRSIRSPHVSTGSPIDTQTSVCTKSTPLTASSGSSVTVIRAPDSAANSAAHRHVVVARARASRGAPIRTSMPSLAPTSSSELATLLRPSPTKA